MDIEPLRLWPKVTNFNRIWASVIGNSLAKTASKSVHLFGWNFVHKQIWTHRDTPTNCSENKTHPLFRGGVKILKIVVETLKVDGWIKNLIVTDRSYHSEQFDNVIVVLCRLEPKLWIFEVLDFDSEFSLFFFFFSFFYWFRIVCQPSKWGLLV